MTETISDEELMKLRARLDAAEAVVGAARRYVAIPALRGGAASGFENAHGKAWEALLTALATYTTTENA